jgi:hypothetical protein
VNLTPGYAWQRPYEAAIVETDRTKLPALIEAAQTAIDARLREIHTPNGGQGNPAEMSAIYEAHSSLRILIAETRAL